MKKGKIQDLNASVSPSAPLPYEPSRSLLQGGIWRSATFIILCICVAGTGIFWARSYIREDVLCYYMVSGRCIELESSSGALYFSIRYDPIAETLEDHFSYYVDRPLFYPEMGEDVVQTRLLPFKFFRVGKLRSQQNGVVWRWQSLVVSYWVVFMGFIIPTCRRILKHKRVVKGN